MASGGLLSYAPEKFSMKDREHGNRDLFLSLSRLSLAYYQNPN